MMIGADLEPIEAQQIQTQPTRHIALKISYLGWTYAGLASQEHQMRANGAPRSSIPDTVESRLLDALEKAMLIASRDPIEINMAKCGRTDKGVSSFAQVFSLDVKSKLSLEDLSVERDLLEKNGTLSEDEVQSIRENEIPYTAILNALLPSDIRALGWSPVSPTFDARFACSGRKYKYFFPAMQLDLRSMHQAVARLPGTTRNFKNFCKVDKNKGLNKTLFERSVYEAYIQPLGKEDTKPSEEEQETGSHLPDSRDSQPTNFYVLVLHGKAFLWHQVRCIMGLLYHVGLGLESIDIIDKLSDPVNILHDKGRPVYTMAAELPLVLVDCSYPPSTFTWLGASPLDNPLASKYTGQKKVKLSRPTLPKSESFDPQWTTGMIPLVHLWKEHQTRAVQILSLLHDALPPPPDGVSAENWVGQMMHELISGDDPMAGWPVQCGSQNVHLMSGSGRGRYTPILERDRTAGERKRPGRIKNRMQSDKDVDSGDGSIIMTDQRMD